MIESGSDFRSEFESKTFENKIHLNNAGLTPVTTAAKKALTGWTDSMSSEGFFIIPKLIETLQGCVENVSRFVGAKPSELAFTPTCAASISQAAFGFELNSGDEVITWDQEYPSNAYPWIAACEKANAKLIRLESKSPFQVNADQVIEKIHSKTKIVALSMVEFQTGAQSNLRKIADACHSVNALLVVDAIQSLGIIPFDFQSSGVDILCGGSHKWLCSPLGLGILVIREELIERCEPLIHGAFTYATPDDAVEVGKKPKADARRFEPGSPATLSILGLDASVRVIQSHGVENIWRKANHLAQKLRAGLKEGGFEVYDSCDDLGIQHKSPIVTFRVKDRDTLAKQFDDNQISYAKRADGIRLSPHAFNTEEEIQAVLSIARSH